MSSTKINMKRSFALMSGDGGDTIKIGTHSGQFHCDEVLACFLLKKIDELKNAEIVRTRDPEVLRQCSVVVDVGGVYDPETHRYDHHQREFQYTISSIRPEFPNKNIRLSSAGLVYAHFGEKIIEQILNDRKLSSDELSSIFQRVYNFFVEEIDAIDNGVPQYPTGLAAYKITTHLSARIGRLNPDWNAPSDVNLDALFAKAMEIVGNEFIEFVISCGKSWLPGRNIVKQAIKESYQVHESGEILELEKFCPWQDHLFTLEKEMDDVKPVKFVLFRDSNNGWRVRGVPTESGGFICRQFLKEEWWGLRDNVLSEKSGVSGTIFCHATGFIAGCDSRDGVLSLAIKSLE